MTYILLRNNKESSPLSLVELSQMGLKPEDLVWVEGQSVCWLHPGEIQELKSLAGKAVKRLTENDQPGNTGTLKSSFTPGEKSDQLAKQEEDSFNNPKKAMLTGYEPVPGNETLHQQEPQENLVHEKLVTETKYARPPDELELQYAKTLEQRAKKMNSYVLIFSMIKKGALYAVLLAAGVITGILIRNNGNKTKPGTQTKTNLPATTLTTKAITPVRDDTLVYQADNSSIDLAKEPADDKVIPGENATHPEKPTARETRPVRDQVSIPTGEVSGNTGIPMEKDEKMNQDARVVKETNILAVDEMSSLVFVKSNEYDVGSFGGIRNLELTVSNTSKYNLDKVIVELRYLKPRDEFLRSENISFHSIPANGSQTLAINKSNRGVKVVFKIIRIESKAISGSTAGLQ